MRDLVRAQLDLDDTDLPDALLDAYIQEGYDRTLELEQRWPFFESQWDVQFAADGTGTMPIDTAHIELVVTADGRILPRVQGRWAMTNFPPGGSTTGNPLYWTRLNRSLYVLPAPGAITTVRLIGFRMGADWVNLVGASGACDCDRRLHIPICWYAASLGYAQQEDEVLEQRYLDRFHESVSLARDAIMRPNPSQPKQVAYTLYRTRPLWPAPVGVTFEVPEAP